MKHDHTSPEHLSQFVALLTEHQSAIRAFIKSLIPNASDIADVLQNTNLVLWEKKAEFTIGTNFRAWAFTIARYRALEYRQKMIKDNLIVFSDEILDMINLRAKSIDSTHTEETHIALDECLRKLSLKNQQLIRARYAGKTNITEFSKLDGRSSGSLRVTLNRLRTTLRDCIDKKLNPSTEI